MRPARPGQAEELRRFVEGLPHRIVQRGAEPAVATHPLYRHALAMPAGEQQQQIGKGKGGRMHARQPGRQRMRFQVVDGQVGNAPRRRDALAERRADQQPADQPRPRRRRHGREVARRDPGLVQHVPNQRRQVLQMRARRDLRHHAAIGGVVGELAQHRLGQHRPVAGQDGRGGLVTTAFKAQHDRVVLRVPHGFIHLGTLSST
jgi:hypothetical protein